MAALALAAPGGIWRAHAALGIDSGKAWGEAVSGAAKSAPGAVADHIRGL